MDKCLIVLDMDGTLLNKRKEISLLTKNYLLELSKQGHKIILASGRPVRSMISYYDELKLDTPMICYNGAFVTNPYNKEYDSTAFTFPIEDVKQIITDLGTTICKVMCESETNIYLDKEDSYLKNYFWYEGMNMIKGDVRDTLKEPPLTFIARLKGTIDKDFIFNTVNKHHNIRARFWTDAPYFELYRIEASKGGCMLDIASMYDIDKDHIIVYGDADNDIELFEHASISVAMSNSKSRVKESATIITEHDNDHDGIYYSLKEILSKRFS
ncbi:MAG: Cof-type HAD-IIB family hydrolase [Bacillales bacterium]|nr:Cof-type HAD-IIB family hydrolase [Bacillales bacterium]MDY6003131.1 Cof-type HAD-IIB family hydrolase [Bacilli bacterium]